jgi:hypothetical protein
LNEPNLLKQLQVSYWFVNARKRLWKPYITDEDQDLSNGSVQVGYQATAARQPSSYRDFIAIQFFCGAFSPNLQPVSNPKLSQEADTKALPSSTEVQISVAERFGTVSSNHGHTAASAAEIAVRDSMHSGASPRNFRPGLHVLTRHSYTEYHRSDSRF